jgi:hypothetical protein
LKRRNNRWKNIVMMRIGITYSELDPFIIAGMDFSFSNESKFSILDGS